MFCWCNSFFCVHCFILFFFFLIFRIFFLFLFLLTFLLLFLIIFLLPFELWNMKFFKCISSIGNQWMNTYMELILKNHTLSYWIRLIGHATAVPNASWTLTKSYNLSGVGSFASPSPSFTIVTPTFTQSGGVSCYVVYHLDCCTFFP